jgi:hypothetical protein
VELQRAGRSLQIAAISYVAVAPEQREDQASALPLRNSRSVDIAPPAYVSVTHMSMHQDKAGNPGCFYAEHWVLQAAPCQLRRSGALQGDSFHAARHAAPKRRVTLPHRPWRLSSAEETSAAPEAAQRAEK